MENDEFQKVCIKNCTCYYFDNTLIDKKLHENILIHNISYKAWIDPKHLRIRFSKIDEFIKNYHRTTYLTLFGSEKYDATYDRIRNLKSLKSDITYLFSHYFAKIEVDSFDYLPIERI